MTLNTNEIVEVSDSTCVYEIYIGGDIDFAKHKLSQMAAEKGMCVSIEPTEFIYTGGRELGMIIRVIRYPRFPSTTLDLRDFAKHIATNLMTYLGQGSCSIVGSEETIWLTRRD